MSTHLNPPAAMALRRITPRRRPVLPVPRAFSSSPPFPPPPPPANDPDPDAAQPPSSSPPPNSGAPRNPESSFFQDIKDRLRSSPTSPSPRRIPTTLPRPDPARGAPSSGPPIGDIRRMLQNFRLTGSTSDAPSTSAPGSNPSFMDLLKNHLDQGANARQAELGFNAIGESLKRPRPPKPFITPSSRNIFCRELERTSKALGARQEENGSAIELKGSYSYEELGKRLGELRPAGAGKDGKEWFSLKELQGRIAKLAEQESQLAGPFSEMRRGIRNLQKQGKPGRPVNIQALLNPVGQPTPDYMSGPPQVELLEKVRLTFYFCYSLK